MYVPVFPAKIMLFYFFLMFAFGGFVWSTYLYFQTSGSSSRRRKRQRALIWMIFFGIVLIFMGLIAVIWQTKSGHDWLYKFLK